MSGVQVGDEVRVFSNSRYHPSPDGGWQGTIVKAGRKYATVTFETPASNYRGGPETYVREVEFDMVSGYEKGDHYGASGLCVKTPARIERDGREEAAVTALRCRKIRLDHGHGFTLEQIEALAEVARTFGQEG